MSRVQMRRSAEPFDLQDGPSTTRERPDSGRTERAARAPIQQLRETPPELLSGAEHLRVALDRDGVFERLLGPDAAAEKVQARGPLRNDPSLVHQVAARGVAPASGTLPHATAIQAAFGHHDISDVRTAVGGPATEACAEIGALAYATGSTIAFSQTPDLRTAAHEAAHVVQQRAGVSLVGGVGRVGDRYERHADEVADHVVQGRSAAPLLDGFGRGAESAVQAKAVQKQGGKPRYTYARSEFGQPEKDREVMGGIRYSSPKAIRAAADEEMAEIETEEATRMRLGATTAKTKGWEGEIQSLLTNVLGVYRAVKSGFARQAGAYQEAWQNMKLVLDAVNQRYQTTATIVGIFLAVTAGFAGGVASGLMATVAGRFSKLVGVNGVPEFTRGIEAGLVEFIKTGIKTPTGLFEYTPRMPKEGTGFSDPASFQSNGAAIIEAECSDVLNFIAYVVNMRGALEGHWSPADFVIDQAPIWAQKKAAAASLLAGVDTKLLEIELWRSWIGENGIWMPGPFEEFIGVEPKLDVPSEVAEHCLNDLGVDEDTLLTWAGVSTTR